MVTLEIAASGGRLHAGILDAGDLTDLWVDRAERRDGAGAILLARIERVFGNRAIAGAEGITALVEWRRGAPPRAGALELIQILRPARGDKAAEATRDVALAGAGLVHRPAGAEIAVSGRLGPAARRDWSARLEGRPGGWIVRSAAAALAPEWVAAEADRLAQVGRTLLARAAAATSPAVLLPAPDVAQRLMLDRPDTARIDVADRLLALRLRGWAERHVPFLVERIATIPDSALPDAAAALADPVVPLPGGGRITIEETQALTAIDVDTGPGAPLAANLEAAAAVARHLRLRAIGGIVVIDFVSMPRPSDRARVVDALRTALAGDPARLTVTDRLSPLGLAELARERRGPSLAEALAEDVER